MQPFVESELSTARNDWDASLDRVLVHASQRRGELIESARLTPAAVLDAVRELLDATHTWRISTRDTFVTAGAARANFAEVLQL